MGRNRESFGLRGEKRRQQPEWYQSGSSSFPSAFPPFSFCPVIQGRRGRARVMDFGFSEEDPAGRRPGWRRQRMPPGISFCLGGLQKARLSSCPRVSKYLFASVQRTPLKLCQRCRVMTELVLANQHVLYGYEPWLGVCTTDLGRHFYLHLWSRQAPGFGRWEERG